MLDGKKSFNQAGFTLIELLMAISVIGFLVVASVVVFNIVRMNARDAVRVGNITTIKRSLAMYLNDSLTGGYPASSGECLKASQGVGKELKDAQVLLEVPLDPLWAASTPSPSVAADADGFCYWYVASAVDAYELSYFLESNSKSGAAGPHTTTQ